MEAWSKRLATMIWTGKSGPLTEFSPAYFQASFNYMHEYRIDYSFNGYGHTIIEAETKEEAEEKYYDGDYDAGDENYDNYEMDDIEQVDENEEETEKEEETENENHNFTGLDKIFEIKKNNFINFKEIMVNNGDIDGKECKLTEKELIFLYPNEYHDFCQISK